MSSAIQLRKKREISYKDWEGKCKPPDTPHNIRSLIGLVGPMRLQQHKKEGQRHVPKRSTQESKGPTTLTNIFFHHIGHLLCCLVFVAENDLIPLFSKYYFWVEFYNASDVYYFSSVWDILLSWLFQLLLELAPLNLERRHRIYVR